MTYTIIGPIIGGIIAGIVGLITVLFRDYLNNKKERTTIVNDLLADIKANLKICRDPASAVMWWMNKYKTEAYNGYKGKLTFLPEKVRNTLAEAVHVMEGVNTAINVHLQRSGVGVAKPEEFHPIEHPDYLVQWLTFCQVQLEKWQRQHASKIKIGGDDRIRTGE